MRDKVTIVLLVIAVIAAFIIVPLYFLDIINTEGMIGIAVTTLIAIAIAWFTTWHAKQNKYDGVRPDIDIERIVRGASPAQSEELIRESAAHGYGDYSQGLSCILRNIGVGTATDVYSFIQTPDRKCQLQPFGALAKDEQTDRLPLSLKERGNRLLLVAYYRDIHDRCFESSREVIKGKVHLGQLKIRKISKEEFPR